MARSSAKLRHPVFRAGPAFRPETIVSPNRFCADLHCTGLGFGPPPGTAQAASFRRHEGEGGLGGVCPPSSDSIHPESEMEYPWHSAPPVGTKAYVVNRRPRNCADEVPPGPVAAAGRAALVTTHASPCLESREVPPPGQAGFAVERCFFPRIAAFYDAGGPTREGHPGRIIPDVLLAAQRARAAGFDPGGKSMRRRDSTPCDAVLERANNAAAIATPALSPRQSGPPFYIEVPFRPEAGPSAEPRWRGHTRLRNRHDKKKQKKINAGASHSATSTEGPANIFIDLMHREGVVIFFQQATTAAPTDGVKHVEEADKERGQREMNHPPAGANQVL